MGADQSQGGVPRLKRFLSEVKDGVVPQTLWKFELVGHTQEAKEELIKYVEFENSENILNSVKPKHSAQFEMMDGPRLPSLSIIYRALLQQRF